MSQVLGDEPAPCSAEAMSSLIYWAGLKDWPWSPTLVSSVSSSGYGQCLRSSCLIYFTFRIMFKFSCITGYVSFLNIRSDSFTNQIINFTLVSSVFFPTLCISKSEHLPFLYALCISLQCTLSSTTFNTHCIL